MRYFDNTSVPFDAYYNRMNEGLLKYWISVIHNKDFGVKRLNQLEAQGLEIKDFFKERKYTYII